MDASRCKLGVAPHVHAKVLQVNADATTANLSGTAPTTSCGLCHLVNNQFAVLADLYRTGAMVPSYSDINCMVAPDFHQQIVSAVKPSVLNQIALLSVA